MSEIDYCLDKMDFGFKKGFAGRRDESGAKVYRVSFGVLDMLLRPEHSLQIVNHSPDGFEWSYSGSGPSQLSLGILLDVFGDETLAKKNYHSFRDDVIARLPKEKWDMSIEVVETWMKDRGNPTVGWLLEQELGFSGRLLAESKNDYRKKYPDHKVFFNANIFAEEILFRGDMLLLGKVWYGDLDLNLDETKLNDIAKRTESRLFVVKELDGRFENENCDYGKICVWKSNNESQLTLKN